MPRRPAPRETPQSHRESRPACNAVPRSSPVDSPQDRRLDVPGQVKIRYVCGRQFLTRLHDYESEDIKRNGCPPNPGNSRTPTSPSSPNPSPSTSATPKGDAFDSTQSSLLSTQS